MQVPIAKRIREGINTKKHYLTNKVFLGLAFSLGLAGVIGVSTAWGASGPNPGVDLYSQCSNDQGTGYSSGDIGCRWINGDLQHSNSLYHESEATPQRL